MTDYVIAHTRSVRRLPDATSTRAAVLLALVLGAVVASAFVDLPGVNGMRAWLNDTGPEAWIVVALGQAIALMGPTPRSALSVLVGALAGFWAGLALVVVGGLLGGLGGFVVSRWLGRGAVVRLAGTRLERLEDRLVQRAFMAVVAARVMPVVPFMLVSYAAGLSSLRLLPYMLGTGVGLLPGSVLYVGLGASITLVTPWLIPAPIALLVGGLLLLGLLAGAVRRRRIDRRTIRTSAAIARG